ncbi:hypothetical protein BCR32DRAFT_273097 [Anaeromyces robustus]|uniref:Uncharacterized protein n=1 Tax=Anaeromyces robustus TaxID=1754192 RepID=A0A1Y1VTZ0_9FUNG|nr:hypothetical protein BCR32DRAFT_273097 [Anaeromyces robustus]|eukprot:ORX64476.1 hypothetical protein BCR32DRAFT_273097 [Anaeromyces robustus]
MYNLLRNEKREKTRVIVITGSLSFIFYLYLTITYLKTDFKFTSVYDNSIILLTVVISIITFFKFHLIKTNLNRWYINTIYYSLVQMLLMIMVLLCAIVYSVYSDSDRFEKACRNTGYLDKLCENHCRIFIVYIILIVEGFCYGLEIGYLLYMKLLNNFEPLIYE